MKLFTLILIITAFIFLHIKRTQAPAIPSNAIIERREIKCYEFIGIGFDRSIYLSNWRNTSETIFNKPNIGLRIRGILPVLQSSSDELRFYPGFSNFSYLEQYSLLNDTGFIDSQPQPILLDDANNKTQIYNLKTYQIVYLKIKFLPGYQDACMGT